MASSDETAALATCLEAGRDLGDDVSIHDWIEADVAFHSCIYAVSGNPVIAETVSEQWPHFKRCMGAVLGNRDLRGQVWKEHAAIVAGILAGDTAAASEAAIFHSEKAGRELHARLGALAKTT